MRTIAVVNRLQRYNGLLVALPFYSSHFDVNGNKSFVIDGRSWRSFVCGFLAKKNTSNAFFAKMSASTARTLHLSRNRYHPSSVVLRLLVFARALLARCSLIAGILPISPMYVKLQPRHSISTWIVPWCEQTSRLPYGHISQFSYLQCLSSSLFLSSWFGMSTRIIQFCNWARTMLLWIVALTL